MFSTHESLVGTQEQVAYQYESTLPLFRAQIVGPFEALFACAAVPVILPVMRIPVHLSRKLDDHAAKSTSRG